MRISAFFKRIYRYVRRELKLLRYLISKYIGFPRVMSIEESIERIQKNRLSISRFGDGDVALMLGQDINFQIFDARLARKLENTIRSENPSLMVCIPDCFSAEGLNSLCDIDRIFWHNHLRNFSLQWLRRLNRKSVYGNTWLSRIYSMKWDKPKAYSIFLKLEKLWKDRDIILIEGAYSRLGVGNNCFASARSIRRILAPAKNSFERYDDILSTALSMGGEILFVLAMGPSATAMAAELTEAGRQALDMGHIDIEYEWMNADVKQKIPIRGKFSNEAFLTGISATEVYGELTNEEVRIYKSQIIADFS